MAMALSLGLALFAVCWVLHLVVWRIRRPQSFALWLPVMLLFLPCVVVGVLVLLQISLPWKIDVWTGLVAFLLHAAISGAYMAGYVSVIGYSPSAEILRIVQANLPEGTPVESVAAQAALSEEALTGRRIANLVESGVAEMADGRLRLSTRGRMILSLCVAYRAVFGIKGAPKG